MTAFCILPFVAAENQSTPLSVNQQWEIQDNTYMYIYPYDQAVIYSS